MVLTLLLRSPAFCSAFECRFCCLRVAAACTRALARARPLCFSRAATPALAGLVWGSSAPARNFNVHIKHFEDNCSNAKSTVPGFDSRLNDVFFLLFFGLGRPVRQTDQFSRPLDAMPKTTTERQAVKDIYNPKIHSPVYFTLYGP